MYFRLWYSQFIRYVWINHLINYCFSFSPRVFHLWVNDSYKTNLHSLITRQNQLSEVDLSKYLEFELEDSQHARNINTFQTCENCFSFERRRFVRVISYIQCLCLVTLFQVTKYEHLQILICNGNALTTLAGVEHIKRLWKLDVGNNQVLHRNSLYSISFIFAIRFKVYNTYHVSLHSVHLFCQIISYNGSNYSTFVICLYLTWDLMEILY